MFSSKIQSSSVNHLIKRWRLIQRRAYPVNRAYSREAIILRFRLLKSLSSYFLKTFISSEMEPNLIPYFIYESLMTLLIFR